MHVNYRKILWFGLAIVTSQILKYDVIAYTPDEGLNYIILYQITPLWKRISEPPEIQNRLLYERPRPTASLWIIVRFILTE